MSVKDEVWPSFLLEIAPTLKSAELLAENDTRQNILNSISECFVKACASKFDPNQKEADYDACLGNPEMMATTCKVVLDQAGIPISEVKNTGSSNTVWKFVVAKLAAMRVDACTNAIKGCLTDKNRCGENYANCFGLDKSDILQMCPKDALTACYQNGVNKSVADLEDMITGLLLNVDNAQQQVCEQEIETKMAEICGDTVSCNAAAFTDESFGAVDFCPLTVINGQTINEDYYRNFSNSSSSSSSSRGGGCVWFSCGGGRKSSSSSSSGRYHYDSSSDDTSMTLMTFLADPEKDQNAEYCSMIKITNTKASVNEDGESHSRSSSSSGGFGGLIIPFFGGGGGGKSSSSSSTSDSNYGMSNDRTVFSASISFAYTPDYNRIEIKDKNVTMREDGTTEESMTLPLASFTDTVVVSEDESAPAAPSRTKMEERVASTINDIVKSIAESPTISKCLTGRDMSQIKSSTSDNGKNVARFPRMFDSYAKIVIRDGKSQAIKNYEQSIRKSKESLKKQAIANAKNALNQTDYSPEEKDNLIKMILSSVDAL